MRLNKNYLLALSAMAAVASGSRLDINDSGSIKREAKKVAAGLMDNWFKGESQAITAGFSVAAPWFWWEAGEMWNGLINYWAYTGDTTYLAQTHKYLQAQIGGAQNFMLESHVTDEANDDQAHWGFAAMNAAEKNFPPPDSGISWVQTVKNIWSFQVRQWDTTKCSGGLSWGIEPSDYKYGYKNAITNGAFFQLSARLALNTGDSQYRNWAQKTWDWATGSGMVTSDYQVLDGMHTSTCKDYGLLRWSINHGIFLHGAAAMYKLTGSSQWKQHVDGLLDAAVKYYFTAPGGGRVMWEPDCDKSGSCNDDARIFKAVLARSMYETAMLAPHTSGTIFGLLGNSAKGASNACIGNGGSLCGTKWYQTDDGIYAPTTQLSALEVIHGLLLSKPRNLGQDVEPLHTSKPVQTTPVEQSFAKTTPTEQTSAETTSEEPMSRKVPAETSPKGTSPKETTYVKITPTQTSQEAKSTSYFKTRSTITNKIEYSTEPSKKADIESSTEPSNKADIEVESQSSQISTSMESTSQATSPILSTPVVTTDIANNPSSEITDTTNSPSSEIDDITNSPSSEIGDVTNSPSSEITDITNNSSSEITPLDLPSETYDPTNSSQQNKATKHHSHHSSNFKHGPSFALGIFCIVFTFGAVVYS